MLDVKILFFIKKTKLLKTGEAPIYLRFTINGQREEITTKRSILPEMWNAERQCARGSTRPANEINTFIHDETIKIRNVIIQLEQNNSFIDANVVMNKYLGKGKSSNTILELFQKHNDECYQLIGKDLRKSTVERYSTCARILKEYIQHQYKKDDVNIREIDYDFIKDFEFYLKTVRKCNNNTTVKYIKNFRKIILIALKRKMISYDPFFEIKFKLDKVNRDPLTMDEIRNLINKKFDNERLDQVKDMFVLGCFTGLSYQDMKDLSQSHLRIDSDGTTWINKTRYKTDVPFIVPLLTVPLEIFKKYENHPVCKIRNRLLPVLSNQKMNAYLKEIADICGIEKKFTTHLVRHTFATTVALAHRIPINVISKILGHSNARMTEIYALTLTPEVKSAMLGIDQELNDFFKKESK